MTTNGSATLFQVSDLQKAIRFYVETLGFVERFRYGTFYAGVQSGDVQIHLSCSEGQTRIGAGQIYIFCDAVDAYYDVVVAKGATSLDSPKDHDYGLRDFLIADPDGNRLGFGAETGAVA
jgi:catechol 2,3-dioxygenase-like lactoylglutathione lyase family enzyme